MRSLLRIGAFIACSPILFNVSGSAQVRALSPEDLTRQSDAVVIGKVASVRSEWTGGRSRIQTKVTLAVEEVLKGEKGKATLDLVTPGGEVDGIGEYYSHTAQFKQDEDVVVFVRKDREGRYRVAAGDQGKMVIREDRGTGKRMVSEGAPLDLLTTRVREATNSLLR